MNWIASFAKYPYAQVTALPAAEGDCGRQHRLVHRRKGGLHLERPLGRSTERPPGGKALEGDFGVVPFPGTVPGASTLGQGNFNIIPKGAAHPAQAFEFITWLAGYHNEAFTASIDPKGGWVPAGLRSPRRLLTSPG